MLEAAQTYVIPTRVKDTVKAWTAAVTIPDGRSFVKEDGWPERPKIDCRGPCCRHGLRDCCPLDDEFPADPSRTKDCFDNWVIHSVETHDVGYSCSSCGSPSHYVADETAPHSSFATWCGSALTAGEPLVVERKRA